MTQIQKAFGATLALDGVDLSVHEGEVLALVGENGAGKSTLVKVLAGIHPPDQGTMTLFGEPFRPQNPADARRAGVSIVNQELSIAPDLSVAENIVIGEEPTARGLVDWKTLHERARAALNEVGKGDLDLNARAGDLPIATQQIVEIARAVALGSRVLILDEPTSSLAKEDVEQLFGLVRRLRERGNALVYISHFMEEIRGLSDRYTVIRDGRTVGTGITAEATEATIVQQMVGREVDALYPRSERTPGEVVLEVGELAGRSLPKNVSLTVRRGEVIGIAGLVGAGRTEFLRALFGLDEIRSGGLKSNLITKSLGKRHARWPERLGMVSEDRKREGLALNRSIEENLTLPTLHRFVNPAELQTRATHWIDHLGVKCASAQQTVGELSGGNQQKVALARLLDHDSEILLLDEPTKGIDIGAKARIYHEIDRLATQGKAIILVSSYLPELMGVCDRIAVMSRGVLGEAKPVQSVTEDSIMAEATGAANP